MARATQTTVPANQMALNFERPHAADAFAAMAGFFTNARPDFLPAEPAQRSRGWGGKSILDESEDE